MVYNSSNRLSYDQAIQNEIALQEASGGKKTNPLWTSEISTEAFATAVKNSLQAEGLYAENGRYHLTVNMQKTEQPMFGLDLQVTTHVNYILTDSTDNSVVLDETIVASHTATVGDAFVAVKRLRLANEGSGRENIKGLLEKLAELNISASQVALDQ